MGGRPPLVWVTETERDEHAPAPVDLPACVSIACAARSCCGVRVSFGRYTGIRPGGIADFLRIIWKKSITMPSSAKSGPKISMKMAPP